MFVPCIAMVDIVCTENDRECVTVCSISSIYSFIHSFGGWYSRYGMIAEMKRNIKRNKQTKKRRRKTKMYLCFRLIDNDVVIELNVH